MYRLACPLRGEFVLYRFRTLREVRDHVEGNDFGRQDFLCMDRDNRLLDLDEIRSLHVRADNAPIR